MRHASLGNDPIPVPADYDNDGAMNVAIAYDEPLGVFPSVAALEWRVRNQPWKWCGLKDDVPVPGDYNGDGAADFAAYSESSRHAGSSV